MELISMTENELRVFLRATPNRVYSTVELAEHFPPILKHAGQWARQCPELVARKTPYVPKRGLLKGKPCHHYFWQDDAAMPIAAAPVAPDGLAELRAACTAAFNNLRIADLNLEQRLERLERIARMIGHDL
jgi:hypothetical protein